MELASPFTNPKQFQKADVNAYNAVIKKGFNKIVFAHMEYLVKRLPEGGVTKSEAKKIAKKYPSRRQFRKKDFAIYILAKGKGWLDEIIPIDEKYKKHDRKEVEKIFREANDRKEIQENNLWAYRYAQRHGLLGKLTKNLKRKRKTSGRIYAIEFEDKSVLVGLSVDTKVRISHHFADSYASKMNKNMAENLKEGLKYRVKVFPKVYKLEVLSKKETIKKNEYKRKGWRILNIAKTGGLGGGELKYSREDIIKIIEKSKIEYLRDFKIAHKGLFQCLKKNYSDLMPLLEKFKNRIQWNESKVRLIIPFMKNISYFKSKYIGAYMFLKRNLPTKREDILSSLGKRWGEEIPPLFHNKLWML